jgi:hypothetical protein
MVYGRGFDSRRLHQSLLLPAEATLLGRIAAALRSAFAMPTGVAHLLGGGLTTALAGLASAAGAGAAFVHCVVHRDLLCVVGFDGHWLSDEPIVLTRARRGLKERAAFLEQTR